MRILWVGHLMCQYYWTLCVLSCAPLFVTLWTLAHQISSVHGISQARILEQVDIFSSRGPSQSRVWTLFQERGIENKRPWDECLCLLKCRCWNLIPNVMALGGRAFGRWLGHKSEAFMKSISALIRDPRGFPCPIHHARTLWEGTVCEPGSGFSPDTKHVGALIFDF